MRLILLQLFIVYIKWNWNFSSFPSYTLGIVFRFLSKDGALGSQPGLTQVTDWVSSDRGNRSHAPPYCEPQNVYSLGEKVIHTENSQGVLIKGFLKQGLST